MSELSVQIVDTKVLSDGHIAFLARCNNDPLSDSWHTYAVNPDASDVELDAAIEAEITNHQQRVAKLHRARTTAAAKILSHRGETKRILSEQT